MGNCRFKRPCKVQGQTETTYAFQRQQSHGFRLQEVLIRLSLICTLGNWGMYGLEVIFCHGVAFDNFEDSRDDQGNQLPHWRKYVLPFIRATQGPPSLADTKNEIIHSIETEGNTTTKTNVNVKIYPIQPIVDDLESRASSDQIILGMQKPKMCGYM
ncbi:unnamed protein product [Orchesella dallaii]|uniref:Uncharacterized protein n=1 Tax=Orchesella dallaii TaxID=48710 RepID=A0ABP1R611_9HEXA